MAEKDTSCRKKRSICMAPFPEPHTISSESNYGVDLAFAIVLDESGKLIELA